MNRKGFFKTVGLAFGTWFISACSSIGIDIGNTNEEIIVEPTSTKIEETRNEQATEIVEESTEIIDEEIEEEVVSSNGKVKVVFVKTDDRVYGVQKAIELFGSNPVDGKSVFLKPNFNSDHATPGSTHPDVLREIVLQLQHMGAAGITIGDRSGMKETREVMNNLGVFEMAEELGVDTVVFNELSADEWMKIETPDSHWSRGFYFPEPALKADAIVQTCCLKTHQYGGHFTMALKNTVGLVAKTVPGDKHNYMTELHNSEHQRTMIAEINSVYEPALVLIDGVEAFTDGGPHQGTRVNSNVVLAGTDMVALDAVGVAILRYFGTTPEVSEGSVLDQEQIARAVELGLGVDSPDMIEFVTPDDESAEYAEEIRKILVA